MTEAWSSPRTGPGLPTNVATFLLTFNPRRWEWRDLGDTIEQVRRDYRVADTWSCGRTRRIREGDRLFLLRQGEEPRGIVGSGWATSEPYEERHWEDSGPLARTARYVDLEWDALYAEPVIPRTLLDDPPFAGTNWNTRSSGLALEADVARALEREWGRRLGSFFEPLADEVADVDRADWVAYQTAVNAYERNATARAACIAHFGARCAACGLDLGERYGAAAAGLIRVHHVVPVSSIGPDYTLDPITDLRPICPNCHAVLHRREPPYEVEEVAAMVSRTSRVARPRTVKTPAGVAAQADAARAVERA